MMDDLNEGGLGDLLDMQWLQITFHHGNPYDGDGDDEDDNDNNIKTLTKAQQTHSIEYFGSFNTFSSKQKFHSTNSENLVKLQLGFVWQRAIDT